MSGELHVKHIGSVGAGALCDTVPVAPMAHNDDQRVEVKRPPLNPQTYGQTDKIKYRLDTEAKGSTGFRILKTLI